METVVLKFGGSSVADNEKLDLVVEKIKEYYENKNIVVVVSAQGKMTDKLLCEAKELSKDPNERELDVLLSCGEQITMAKLSILLNAKNIPAISLTGWQAGIITNEKNQNAIIEDICLERINKELDSGKVVIVAGFQGINQNIDISTLGRGGSDTTAVALAAKLNASDCLIFSDVDGVYTADPKQVKDAKKLNTISYNEMMEIADEGAKVLHNRCIRIGQKYGVKIVAKSTFNNENGTVVQDKIENNGIKSMIKKDVSRITFIGIGLLDDFSVLYKIINLLSKLKINVLSIDVDESKISILFKNVISNDVLKKFHKELIT